MLKKRKEWKQKENNRYKIEEKKRLKVLNNLHKLAKKKTKIINTVTESKSNMHIQKYKPVEKSELGTTMSKNLSMLKSASSNTLIGNKLYKTQKKPRTKKIKQKIDSPSKILSSDSELDEMSPRRYIDYCNIMTQLDSEKVNKYKMMPLQRRSESNEPDLQTPARFETIGSDCLRDINDGTQHGWLASQQETDNESEIYEAIK